MERSHVTHARSDSERKEAVEFWYRVYRSELRKKTELVDEDRLAYGEVGSTSDLLLFRQAGEIVGTLMRSPVVDAASTCETARVLPIRRLSQEIDVSTIVYYSRLVVAKEHRSGSTMQRLVSYAYDLEREEGNQIALIVASPHLVALYERLGFQLSGQAATLRGLGILCPMALAIDDLEHLRRVRSPFARSKVTKEYSPAGRRALNAVVGELRESSGRGKATDEEGSPWDSLIPLLERGSLQEEPREDASPGLQVGEDVLAESQQLGEVVDVADGEIVYEHSSPQIYLCVILSGAIEATLIGSQSEKPLLALGPGQVFGENAAAGQCLGIEYRTVSASRLLLIRPATMAEEVGRTPAGRLCIHLLRALAEKFWLVTRDLSQKSLEEQSR